MKKNLLALVTLVFLLVTSVGIFKTLTQQACGAGTYKCYTCKGGGYVCYSGKDTFELRKQAKAKYGCEVTGTSSSCTEANCKGRFLK